MASGSARFGIKLVSFSISVGLTAMVGGIWAYYEGFIYPQFAVDPLVTIAIVLMTFLGGRATLWGPVLGAFILETAQQTLAYSLGGSQFYLIAYAHGLPARDAAHAAGDRPFHPGRPATAATPSGGRCRRHPGHPADVQGPQRVPRAALSTAKGHA